MGDSTPKDPYGNSIDEEILFYMEGQPFYAKVDPHSKARKAEQEAKRVDALQAEKPWLRDNFAYEPVTAEGLAQATAYQELSSLFTDFNKASRESHNLYSDTEAVKGRADFKLLVQDRISDATSMFGSSKAHLGRYVGEKVKDFENVFSNRNDFIAKKRLLSEVNKQFESSTGQYLAALQDPDSEPDVLEAAQKAFEYTSTAQGKYNFEPPEKYQKRIKESLQLVEFERNLAGIQKAYEQKKYAPQVESTLLQEFVAFKTNNRCKSSETLTNQVQSVATKLHFQPLLQTAFSIKMAYLANNQGVDNNTSAAQQPLLPPESVEQQAQAFQQEVNSILQQEQKRKAKLKKTYKEAGIDTPYEEFDIPDEFDAITQVLLRSLNNG